MGTAFLDQVAAAVDPTWTLLLLNERGFRSKKVESSSRCEDRFIKDSGVKSEKMNHEMHGLITQFSIDFQGLLASF